MRVIGIDPGTVTTGYGVVDGEDHRLSYVASGSITPAARQSLPKRLKKIYDELVVVFRSQNPTAVVVENTFVSKHFQSALKLGQAHGIALLAAEACGLPVYECMPTEVKLAVVGYGAARKDQVESMVGRLLNLKTPPDSHHAADALAVAICYLHSAKFRALTTMAVGNHRVQARRSCPL
jgi:crossover junction endodeoxyribonuclease RuvC